MSLETTVPGYQLEAGTKADAANNQRQLMLAAAAVTCNRTRALITQYSCHALVYKQNKRACTEDYELGIQGVEKKKHEEKARK